LDTIFHRSNNFLQSVRLVHYYNSHILIY